MPTGSALSCGREQVVHTHPVVGKDHHGIQQWRAKAQQHYHDRQQSKSGQCLEQDAPPVKDLIQHRIELCCQSEQQQDLHQSPGREQRGHGTRDADVESGIKQIVPQGNQHTPGTGDQQGIVDYSPSQQPQCQQQPHGPPVTQWGRKCFQVHVHLPCGPCRCQSP